MMVQHHRYYDRQIGSKILVCHVLYDYLSKVTNLSYEHT